MFNAMKDKVQTNDRSNNSQINQHYYVTEILVIFSHINFYQFTNF